MQDAAAETAGRHVEHTHTYMRGRRRIGAVGGLLRGRRLPVRGHLALATRVRVHGSWCNGRWWAIGGWWWAVGGWRLAVGGCRSVGDGCRVRAWWWAPYNVVLSRRHEPVEHNRTCARNLGRKSQDLGCGRSRSRSRSRSEERGVVVREILWSGRGVTNTRGPLRSGCRSAVGSANGVKGASERREPGEQTRAARQAGGV
jgi:hypothetical protein